MKTKWSCFLKNSNNEILHSWVSSSSGVISWASPRPRQIFNISLNLEYPCLSNHRLNTEGITVVLKYVFHLQINFWWCIETKFFLLFRIFQVFKPRPNSLDWNLSAPTLSAYLPSPKWGTATSSVMCSNSPPGSQVGHGALSTKPSLSQLVWWSVI